MLLVVDTMDSNDSPTVQVFRWLFMLLLFCSLLVPEQAIRDLFWHVITISSLRQLLLEFLQVKAQKGNAPLYHSSPRFSRHHLIELQEFCEEAIEQVALPIGASPER